MVSNTITFGVSALAHEDYRYYRSKADGFGARLGYVITSPYLARAGDGHQRLSAAQFMGSAGYAGIPLLWSPPSWQGWDNVAINYLIWYGTRSGVNLIREFYPSVVRHYRDKKNSKDKH